MGFGKARRYGRRVAKANTPSAEEFRIMRKLIVWIVMFIVGLSSPALAAAVPAAMDGAPQAVQATNSQDKADKDRKKAAEKEAKDVKEDEKLLDQAQESIDAYALELLTLKYDDPFLQEYVNELGQSLVPSETPEGVLFSFRVINVREPNAMALPDGRIFVTTGLLTFINNEAQLAFVLGHEIGHVVERHYAKGVREARTRARIGALVGAGLGAVIGGLSKGKDGAVGGLVAGAAVGYAIAAVTMNNYSRQQEDEADRRGIMLALDRKFDAKEADVMFQRLATTFGEQDKFTNALWGRHSRNLERVENVDRLLAGELSSRYNSMRGKGDLSLGSAQMHLYTSAMIRDTAIWYMDADDRYDLAKGLLEQISSIRARDPKTLWALGKVYKTVGRTDADRSKALDLLQQAVRLDERGRFPMIRRDYGLMQARMGNTAGAVESLRGYILNHMELTSLYPNDIDKMYDYLLTFGDSKWTAPRIDTRMLRAEGPSAGGPPQAAPAVSTPTDTTKTPQNTLRPPQVPARPQPRKP
jgi:predicted Zn-dependent protease